MAISLALPLLGAFVCFNPPVGSAGWLGPRRKRGITCRRQKRKTEAATKGTTPSGRTGRGCRFSSAYKTRNERDRKKAAGSQTQTQTQHEAPTHAMFEEIFVVLWWILDIDFKGLGFLTKYLSVSGRFSTGFYDFCTSIFGFFFDL